MDTPILSRDVEVVLDEKTITMKRHLSVVDLVNHINQLWNDNFIPAEMPVKISDQGHLLVSKKWSPIYLSNL